MYSSLGLKKYILYKCKVCNHGEDIHLWDGCIKCKNTGKHKLKDGKQHFFKYHYNTWKRFIDRMCENGRTFNKQKCKIYKICPENNHCPSLKNPRGGDFGWGECIHEEK